MINYGKISLVFGILVTQSMTAFDNETMNYVTAGVGATAGIYALGVGYRTLLTAYAQHKYRPYRQELPSSKSTGETTAPEKNSQEQVTRSEEALAKVIFDKIKKNHRAEYDASLFTDDFKDVLYKWFCLSNTFDNYPYARFKDEVDGYITELSILRIFYCGKTSSEKLNALIKDLKTLRNLVSQNDIFINEKRHLDERQEDKAERQLDRSLIMAGALLH